MAKKQFRRIAPGDVANAFLRNILAEAGITLGGLTGPQWQETMQKFGGKCAYTNQGPDNVTIEADHAIPSNRFCGGLHRYGNVLPASKLANSQKKGLRYDEFLRSKPGRFSSLNNVSAAQREENIRQIEAFMQLAGYPASVASEQKLLDFYQAKYQDILAHCTTARLQVNALLEELAPATAGTNAGEALDYLAPTAEQSENEEDRTVALPLAYAQLFTGSASRKAGQLAQAVFRQLFADGRIEPYLDLLQERTYCRVELGVYSPVLSHQAEQNRYYAKPLEFKTQRYFLSNDWRREHHDALKQWVTDVLVDKNPA